MAQLLTPVAQQDPGGTTKSIMFDGNDPTYGGVANGVVMAAATETELGSMPLSGQCNAMTLNVVNNGANPFTAMRIQTQAHPNALFKDYITSAELNTGTPVQNKLVQVSSNPTTLAAAADANITIQINGAYAVRVLATSTLGSKGIVRATAAAA